MDSEPGHGSALYLLAFDHRGSFEQLVGDAALVPGAKRLIWDGFRRAAADGVPAESVGILVDAQYAADVARDAKAAGCVLAMPRRGGAGVRRGSRGFRPRVGGRLDCPKLPALRRALRGVLRIA